MADPSGAHDVSGRNVAAAQDARGWPEQHLTAVLRGGRSSDEVSAAAAAWLMFWRFLGCFFFYFLPFIYCAALRECARSVIGGVARGRTAMQGRWWGHLAETAAELRWARRRRGRDHVTNH